MGPPPSASGVLSASPPIRQTGILTGSPPRVASNATRGGLNAIGARGSVQTVTTPATATATATAAATATSGQLQPDGVASSPSYGLVVGLGDPVSDILVRLEDDNLASRVFTTCGIDEPGGCVPVDTDEDIQQLLSVCAGEWVDGAGIPNVTTDEGGTMQETNVAEPTYCPGGSAANVMKGIANLGGEAAFVGMVGRDDVGRKYRELLAAQNVRPVLLEAAATATGDGGDEVLNSAQCLSLVEKGGQRTMRTYLGASLRMGAADFPEEEALEGAKLLHIEGYTLYRPELAKAAMRAAKARGATVSLDMASFEVVRNCRAQLLEILESGLVDLLFANEDEAEELLRFDAKEGELKLEEEEEDDRMKTEVDGGGEFLHFTRKDADRAMAWMLRYCKVATVSMGPRGCVSSDRMGNRGVAPGVRVPVVDTTGAGDSFTAGFLHAYLSGASLQACASCGCAVGTHVVQVLGAELSAAKWNELKGDVRSIIERITH